MVEYDDVGANEMDRAYLTSDVTRQRMRTIEALQVSADEYVLDVGCGTGLLVHDMAALVGPKGHVVGIDVSPEMRALADRRCVDLPQVAIKQGSVDSLSEQDQSFDAVACAQVLLYVRDVANAISEMCRVTKPGGRIAIVETDWRSTILHSFDDTLTRKILATWDDSVPSPNLPERLRYLLGAQGFSAISATAIPILNTSYTPGNFSTGATEQFARFAQQQGAIGKAEATAWLKDLRAKGDDGSYFFCVNRFLFSGVRI